MQIENALTDHHEIREAAAVSVADPTYGEVVGAWIVREPHTKMSHEDVRQSVIDRMNPQVSWHYSPSRTLSNTVC